MSFRGSEALEQLGDNVNVKHANFDRGNVILHMYLKEPARTTGTSSRFRARGRRLYCQQEAKCSSLGPGLDCGLGCIVFVEARFRFIRCFVPSTFN